MGTGGTLSTLRRLQMNDDVPMEKKAGLAWAPFSGSASGVGGGWGW